MRNQLETGTEYGGCRSVSLHTAPGSCCTGIYYRTNEEHRPTFLLFKVFHGVEPHRGVVFLFSKSHGAVRFLFFGNRTVRCGAVRFSLFLTCTVRCSAVSLLKVRCGADYIFCFSRIVRCGAVRLSVAQQLFPTMRLSVHPSGKTGAP